MARNLWSRVIFLSLALCAAGLGACAQKKAAPEKAAGQAATAASSSSPAHSAGGQAAAKAVRIVFLDKEDACDCTRKRVADSWGALQSALGNPPGLPVERLHIDTQASETAPFVKARPLMVPPGIYFLDANDRVLEALQGEVTVEQIRKLMQEK